MPETYKVLSSVPSPVKNPQNVNMVIFRENTEDIYAGIEYAASSDKAKKIIGLLDEFGDKNKIRSLTQPLLE